MNPFRDPARVAQLSAQPTGSHGRSPSPQTQPQPPAFEPTTDSRPFSPDSGSSLTGAVDRDPMDQPPPYTPSAAPTAGEVSLEYGPQRPFQPPPPRPPAHVSPPIAPYLSPMSTGISTSPRRGGSFLSQLTESLHHVTEGLQGRTPAPTTTPGSYNWTSYPGQHTQQSQPSLSQQPPQQNLAPPSQIQRPVSAPSISNADSEFVRDFYAAGSGDGLPLTEDDRPATQNRSTSRSVPNDGRPTTTPMIGHPLLKDGKLLVYPKNHKCSKCKSFLSDHISVLISP